MRKTIFSLFLIFAAVSIIGCAQAQPPQIAPIVIAPADLGLSEGVIRSLTVSENGKLLYLGKVQSRDALRMNLMVATLGADGKIIGAPRAYRDTMAELDEQGAATVETIVPDLAHRKLYLAFSQRKGAESSANTKLLSVYDTDENGEPIGEPRSYESGNPNKSLMALAINPKHRVLYAGGWGTPNISVYKLNDNGEPQGEPQIVPAIGGFRLVVSPDGKKLYIGYYTQLAVYALDGEGNIGAQIFSGTQPGADFTTMQWTPRALYFAQQKDEQKFLARVALDDAGKPQGEPQINNDLPINALATDAGGQKLFVAAAASATDAMTDKAVTTGTKVLTLDVKGDGFTQVNEQDAPTLPFQFARFLVGGAQSTPVAYVEAMPPVVVNYTKGYSMRVSLLDLKKGDESEKISLSLIMNGKEIELGRVLKGETTDWMSLDPWLANTSGQGMGLLQAGLATTSALKVKIEFAEEGKVFKTLNEDVQSGYIRMLLPGYATPDKTLRESRIELLSEHAQTYLDEARKVAIAPEDRPKLFSVSSSHMMGGQGSIPQLEREAEALQLLGFNTVNAYNWPNLTPQTINETLAKYGFTRRSMATYSPPQLFNYVEAQMNPQALDKWATDLFKASARDGVTPENVTEFFVSDEPGWYYPRMQTEVRLAPEYLKAFHQYLQGKNFKPADLGQNSWEGVLPIAITAANDLPSRKLYYWTLQFFQDNVMLAFKNGRIALEKAAGHKMIVPVNYNNFTNRTYVPSPGVESVINLNAGADSAVAGPDWMDAGRQNAHTLWSEDWFADAHAGKWSYFGDVLRSSAQQGERDWGGYVIGATTWQQESGGRYKIMSVAGHGGKAINVFAFGPEWLFPGNCWSENFGTYRNVADGFRMLGRAERLLYPGVPERGSVAIVLPQSSAKWERDGKDQHYILEDEYLHTALILSGYRVDFVDEASIADGALQKNGYQALYLTAPNVSVAAQKQMKEWTQNGGTLITTPGAATADEYNTPTNLLDEVLGLRARAPVRDEISAAATKRETMSFKDARFGNGEVEVSGSRTDLQTDGATPLAQFADGAPAIVAATFGQGRAISFGFFPGYNHVLSGNMQDPTRPIVYTGDWQRRLCAAPAVIAKAERTVQVNHEGVEVCRLQSEKGIAIVLLNWSGKAIDDLEVTIQKPGAFKKVSALESEAKSTRAGDTIKVSMSLKDVDVLMIE